MTRLALTREVSPAFDRCELTHLERVPIDVARAREQHGRYEQCLRELGCRVESLPAEPEFPDSVFVEDVAVVLDEVAVITRPGARSRRGETRSVARALEQHRPLAWIQAPGNLDGGDVVRVGRKLFVGLSRRTNLAAAGQLRGLVEPKEYSVTVVEFAGCLHLKSAATRVARETLLINPDWVDASVFAGLKLLTIDPSEPAAANCLGIGDRAVLAAQHPRTAARLRQRGIELLTVDVSELLKAEAGVTCCSLVFPAKSRQGWQDRV